MYKIGIFTDTYTPQINGVVTVIRMMEKELSKLGHRIYVFAPFHPEQDDLQIELSRNDCKAERILRFPSFKFIFQKEYRVAIPHNREAWKVFASLDVIHSHTPFSMGLLALRVAHKYDLPHIHTYHTFYAEYRHYIPSFIRPPRKVAETFSSYFCNRCHCIIAPSSQIKKELEGYGLKTPIISLPFGVDLERFDYPQKAEFDPGRVFQIHDEEKLLLSVGRLGKEKNIDFLLRAFKRLLSYRDNVKLIIAGDGPERNRLKKKAKEELGDRVVFTGYIDEDLLSNLYKKADVFVFASKTETQGIVIVEAFASGTPVVCIGEMGVVDLVEDGETGILVNEDEEKFALECHKLLQDKNRRKIMSKKAKERAFSMSSRRSTEKLVKIYDYFLNTDKNKERQERFIQGLELM